MHRGVAAIRRGLAALQKAVEVHQNAQMMNMQCTYGSGGAYNGGWGGNSGFYGAPGGGSSMDGGWGGGGRSSGNAEHAWGGGQRLGEERASASDIEAAMAMLRTPGAPEALREMDRARRHR